MSLLIPFIHLNQATPIWGYITRKCGLTFDWKVCAVFTSEGEFALKMHGFNQGMEEQVAKGYIVDEGKEVLYELCTLLLYYKRMYPYKRTPKRLLKQTFAISYSTLKFNIECDFRKKLGYLTSMNFLTVARQTNRRAELSNAFKRRKERGLSVHFNIPLFFLYKRQRENTSQLLNRNEGLTEKSRVYKKKCATLLFQKAKGLDIAHSNVCKSIEGSIRHPFKYDGYNYCDMVICSNLTLF